MGWPMKPIDVCLLSALSEVGAFTTVDACRAAGLPAGRSEAARRRLDLIHLERGGLVRRLDDKSPTAWLRTPAGTEELVGRASDDH